MRIWGAVFGPADMQYRRPKVEEIQVSSPAFMICAVLHRCLPIRVIGEILGRSENQVDRIIRRYVGSRGGDQRGYSEAQRSQKETITCKTRCKTFHENRLTIGAGEGNRTLVCSLGSCRSTIELRPRTRTIPNGSRTPQALGGHALKCFESFRLCAW